MEAKTLEQKLTFTCPECSANLKVPIRLAGVTGPCPKCGETITAPEQSEEPRAPKTTKTFASLRGTPSRPRIQTLVRDPQPHRPAEEKPANSVKPTTQPPRREPSPPAEAKEKSDPAVPTTAASADPDPSPSPATEPARKREPESAPQIGANTLLPPIARIPQGPQSTLFMPPPERAAPQPAPAARETAADPAPVAAPEGKPIDRTPEEPAVPDSPAKTPEPAAGPSKSPKDARPDRLDSPPLAVEPLSPEEPADTRRPDIVPDAPELPEVTAEKPEAASEKPVTAAADESPDALRSKTPVSLPRPQKLTPPAKDETTEEKSEADEIPAPVRSEKKVVSAPHIDPKPQPAPARATDSPSRPPADTPEAKTPVASPDSSIASEPARKPSVKERPAATPQVDLPKDPKPLSPPSARTESPPERPVEKPAAQTPADSPVSTAPGEPVSERSGKDRPAVLKPEMLSTDPKPLSSAAGKTEIPTEDSETATADVIPAGVTHPTATDTAPSPPLAAPAESSVKSGPTSGAPKSETAEPRTGPRESVEPEEIPVPTASITMPHFAVDGLDSAETDSSEFVAPAPSASPHLPPPKKPKTSPGPSNAPAESSQDAGPVLLPEPKSDRLGVASRKSLFTIKADEAETPEEESTSPLSSGPPISHLDSVLPQETVFTPRHQEPVPQAPQENLHDTGSPHDTGNATTLGLEPIEGDSPIPQPGESDSNIDIDALFGTPVPQKASAKKSRSGLGRFLVTAAVMIVTGLSVAFIGELFGAWSLFGGAPDPSGATGKGREIARGPDRDTPGNGGPDSPSSEGPSGEGTGTVGGTVPKPENGGSGHSPVTTGTAETSGTGLVISDTTPPTGETGEDSPESTGVAETTGPGSGGDTVASIGEETETVGDPDTIVFPEVTQLPAVEIPDENIDIFATEGGGDNSAGSPANAVIGPPGPEPDTTPGVESVDPGDASAVPRPGPESASDPGNGYEVVATIGDGVAPVSPATTETPGNPPGPPAETADSPPAPETETMTSETGATADASPATAAASPATAVTPTATDYANEEGELGECRATIIRFLEAATWQERLPHIYAGDVLRDKIEKYYQNHPDQAITEYHLKYLLMDENPVDGDFPLHVFFVNIEGEEREFPITVRTLPDGKKVDWEAFVEFHGREFGKFLESGDTGPRVFRVIIERQSFWGADRSKMANHLSYQVESPDPEFSTHAFVPANTVLSTKLEKYFSWGAGPIATTVELEKQTLPHGESHYIINRLVTDPEASDGWHVKPGTE